MPQDAPTSSRPTLSDKQFETLRDIIYNRSGIHFPDTKKYVLASRLGRRLEELELASFDEYAAFLTMGPYQVEEFQEMFNRITINETSFFRNQPQLDVFENRVLPGLLEARSSTKRLRVWSAACSSGEEPFTLAMILHRTLGIRLSDWKVEILGTDISGKALEVANGGRYSNYAMRSTPEIIKQRFFTPAGDEWELDPSIRSMVNFELHNLKDRLAAKRHGLWDVIFCRNVMIYFDKPMRGTVINMFADQLAKDGALFIGHSETVQDVTDRLEPYGETQGFCYRGVGAAGAKTKAA